jgi:hypothetical protein
MCCQISCYCSSLLTSGDSILQVKTHNPNIPKGPGGCPTSGILSDMYLVSVAVSLRIMRALLLGQGEYLKGHNFKHIRN